MLTLEKYCEENNLDVKKVFELVLGDGGSLLPGRAFTGYFAQVTDTGLVCVNDKLGVKKEIPFSDFQSAEFGIGSGNLWLQCIVGGSPFVFCTTRKIWKKSSAVKFALEKIEEHTPIEGKKEYDHFTGKLFFIYIFK